MEPSTLAFCGEDSLDQQHLDLLNRVVAGGPDGAGGFALEMTAGTERMEYRNSGSAPAQLLTAMAYSVKKKKEILIREYRWRF